MGGVGGKKADHLDWFPPALPSESNGLDNSLQHKLSPGNGTASHLVRGHRNRSTPVRRSRTIGSFAGISLDQIVARQSRAVWITRCTRRMGTRQHHRDWNIRAVCSSPCNSRNGNAQLKRRGRVHVPDSSTRCLWRSPAAPASRFAGINPGRAEAGRINSGDLPRRHRKRPDVRLLRQVAYLDAVIAVGLSNAIFLTICSLVNGPLVGRWNQLTPIVSVASLVDLVEMALLIWLLREMPPIRLSARYLLTPLLTVSEGYVLLQPQLTTRLLVGAALLAAGAAWILFARIEEGAPTLSLR